ncbi:MAG: Integrase [Frankiales bacterium]|nr:Integrase [Frankiales bacterium]
MSTKGSAGEASIFKGSDGRWHGWITVGTKANGQPDRRHRTAKTRGEVAKKVRELEVRRETGTITAANSDTVGGWLEHWLTTITPNRVRPRTLESYKSMIRLHVAPYLGTQRLDRLQPEHLEELYQLLLQRGGLSATSVLRVHRVLSRALKVAMQRQRIHRNVAALVDPPAQRKTTIATALEPAEAIAVLRTATTRRNAARWIVALALGLRQSEALALQWSDIDLLGGTLEIHRTLHRVKGKGLVYEAPKTNKSERKLALSPTLLRALIEHKRLQTGERMLAGTDWHDEDLVFAQPNGRPIDKKADYAAWCALLKDAGVRHVRLHDARHTAATMLLVAGEHPRVVMELLVTPRSGRRWTSYSHVMPALARDAANRMDAILFGPDPTDERPGTLAIEGELQPLATKAATRVIEPDGSEASSPLEMGGAEGTRTPDPHTASVVRYQLRHSPSTTTPPSRSGRRQLPILTHRSGPKRNVTRPPTTQETHPNPRPGVKPTPRPQNAEVNEK